MRIYLIDDEEIILNGELELLRECCPEDEIEVFQTEEKFLQRVIERPCDVAFMDINLAGTDGIHVGKRLKEIVPNVNIIFLTAYDNYYREAMGLRVSGYLLKPLSKADVLSELDNLRYAVSREIKKRIQVTCFGNFDVKKMDGTPVRFERSKSKEAFAYLIHLNGSSCTIRELAAVLFEDEPFDRKNQMYIQKIVSSLMKNLREIGAERVIEKGFNSLAVNPALIECDYYQFLEEDSERRFSRPDIYMEQYSWALY